ncbi:MAG TPA: DUF3047 domain-containing protein [Balneolaceae bacterium]|nr:DUF3047 domain-containing protein [Balneolaceae bacterium]
MASLLVGFILIGGAAHKSCAQELKRLGDGKILIDNFQEDTTGHLPAGWYDRDGDKQTVNFNARERAKYHYKVMEEDGNKFLRYEGMEAMHLNFPLTNKQGKNIYNIDVYKTPVLSWKWRVFKLPHGGDVNNNSKNDAAASVYVVWGFGHVLFKKVPKSVRYVWGSSEPAGATFSNFFGNQKIVVLKSGPTDEGKWITMHRNIVKDYKHLFGDNPPKAPLAILILSDGDNTRSLVKADYDDIMLEPARSVDN